MLAVARGSSDLYCSQAAGTFERFGRWSALVAIPACQPLQFLDA